MRLHLFFSLLLLAVSCHGAAGDPYRTINQLRGGGGDCAGAEPLPPLRAQEALERAARDLARGNQLEQSLTAAGYRATRASALTFSGNGIGAKLAEILAKPDYCGRLQDARMKDIGIYLEAKQVWIVIAAPFAPMAGIDARAAERLVLDLVNKARATRQYCGNTAFPPVRPVRWNDTLARASRLHAADMARFDYFSHSGRDGSTPPQRVARAGYSYQATGENIAGGQMNPEEAVAGWIKSPTHCANLMNPLFTEMGVAFTVDRKSKMGVYWAQEFGTPR